MNKKLKIIEAMDSAMVDFAYYLKDIDLKEAISEGEVTMQEILDIVKENILLQIK